MNLYNYLSIFLFIDLSDCLSPLNIPFFETFLDGTFLWNF